MAAEPHLSIQEEAPLFLDGQILYLHLGCLDQAISGMLSA